MQRTVQQLAPSGIKEGDELLDPTTEQPFGIVTKTQRKRTGHVTVWYRNSRQNVVYMDLPKIVKKIKISQRCQDCTGNGCAPCNYTGHQHARQEA